jgi:hypothetical protein
MDAEEYRMKISRDWKAVVDYAREEVKTQSGYHWKSEEPFRTLRVARAI